MTFLMVSILVLIINSFILIRINWIKDNPSSPSIFKKNINEPQFTKEESRANDLITCGIIQLCVSIIFGTFFLLIFKVNIIKNFISGLTNFDIINFLMTFNLALWLMGVALTITGFVNRFRLENSYNKDLKLSLMKLSFSGFYKK
ncbi:MAG TPA: hypothetical protein VFF33_13750 [Ignavibacteriaceae bacterium]|nr:hypothetical protein [Ignavibacteriaceae bacterium]